MAGDQCKNLTPVPNWEWGEQKSTIFLFFCKNNRIEITILILV
jgi:hypothetical protein